MSALLRGITTANVSDATTTGRNLMKLGTPGSIAVVTVDNAGSASLITGGLSKTQTPVTACTVSAGIVTALT